MVKNDLKNKIKDKGSEDTKVVVTKKPKKLEVSLKQQFRNDQFLYDNVNPKYCYCGGGSYGEMIGCESTFCEK